MIHPILSNRVNLISYILIWFFIAILQMSIIYYYFAVELLCAATDAIVVGTIHGLIGLAIWYPLRFNPVINRNYFIPVFNIVATGFLTVSLWVGISYTILRQIFPGQEAYNQFLEQSLPYRIFTDMLFYIVLALVYSLITYSINLRQKISDESNLRTLVREAELNMLKSQINPHFLFNSLNSISMLTRKDAGKAREMIIKLSEFLRYSLRTGDAEYSSLREEMENMKRYMEIEKIRFGDKLNFTAQVDENLLEWPVPNMILQPLFENAVKHGVYESTAPINIRLLISQKSGMLHIEIINEYDPASNSRRGSGIGLKNISDRLKLNYGRDDLINHEGNNGVFRVSVKLPPVNSEN